jgi:hypothetical protein
MNLIKSEGQKPQYCLLKIIDLYSSSYSLNFSVLVSMIQNYWTAQTQTLLNKKSSKNSSRTNLLKKHKRKLLSLKIKKSMDICLSMMLPITRPSRKYPTTPAVLTRIGQGLYRIHRRKRKKGKLQNHRQESSRRKQIWYPLSSIPSHLDVKPEAGDKNSDEIKKLIRDILQKTPMPILECSAYDNFNVSTVFDFVLRINLTSVLKKSQDRFTMTST